MKVYRKFKKNILTAISITFLTQNSKTGRMIDGLIRIGEADILRGQWTLPTSV